MGDWEGLPDHNVHHHQSHANNNDTSTTGTENRKRRRSSKLTLPKILKNDIRRYYIRMFMNTINSSDLFIVEDFFNTFMARPCRCVSMQTLDPALDCPPNVLVYGSRMITHYFLGIFLMFPDIIMKLVDSKIITSSGYAGSKIQIDMDIEATKASIMPVEAWIPNEACLPLLYRQRSMHDIVRVVRAFSSPDYMNVDKQQHKVWLDEWMKQTPAQQQPQPQPLLQVQEREQHWYSHQWENPQHQPPLHWGLPFHHHHYEQHQEASLSPLPAIASTGLGSEYASLALPTAAIDPYTQQQCSVPPSEVSLLEAAAAHILTLTHATQTVDEPLPALPNLSEAASFSYSNNALHQLAPHSEIREEAPTEGRWLRSSSKHSNMLPGSSNTSTNRCTEMRTTTTTNTTNSSITRSTSSSGVSSTDASAPQITHTHMPSIYSDVVSQQLTPLPVPIPLKATARVTFYLDVSNHIQFLSLNLQNKRA